MSESLCLASACGQLRVRFIKADDRFGHVIEHKSGNAFEPLLWSVEGTPQDDWPPSSPLKDVRQCGTGNDQICLLGTGMAGRSFWSLSLTQSDDALVFDHACRPATGDIPHAVTTYETSLEFTQRHDVATAPINPAAALVVTPVSTQSNDRPSIEIAERRLRIKPFQHPPQRKADRTIRWALRFQVTTA